MKKRQVSKRQEIKIISVSLALILGLGGSCLYYYKQSKRYKTAMENTYKHSLQDFNDYINNIYNYLDKGLYVNTPYQLSNLSAKLLSDSKAATICLSALPASELHLDNTFKFLSQVGAYAASLNKKYHASQKITDKDYDSLITLKEYAKKLNDYTSKIESQMLRENLDLESTNLINKPNVLKKRKFEINFEDMEKNFVSYPKLVYDGPFSDHIEIKQPEITKVGKEVSPSQAKKIAAIITGIDENKLTQVEDEKSNLPLYCFQDRDIRVGVTKQGGKIRYIIKARAVPTQKIDPGQAIENAKTYINDILKITDIEQSYYEINNNCCLINFIKKQDEVVIYPDLIKVSVALDNGEILSVDLKSYLSNHKGREIKEAKKTSQEAQKILSKYLTVLKEPRRAIIPSEGENELDTYEFICRGKSDEIILVYINSDTLEEEQILILSESDDGILTI